MGTCKSTCAFDAQRSELSEFLNSPTTLCEKNSKLASNEQMKEVGQEEKESTSEHNNNKVYEEVCDHLLPLTPSLYLLLTPFLYRKVYTHFLCVSINFYK